MSSRHHTHQRMSATTGRPPVTTRGRTGSKRCCGQMAVNKRSSGRPPSCPGCGESCSWQRKKPQTMRSRPVGRRKIPGRRREVGCSRREDRSRHGTTTAIPPSSPGFTHAGRHGTPTRTAFPGGQAVLGHPGHDQGRPGRVHRLAALDTICGHPGARRVADLGGRPPQDRMARPRQQPDGAHSTGSSGNSPAGMSNSSS
jgi:hypothetical protein